MIAKTIRIAVMPLHMSNLRSTIQGLASGFANSILEALRSASIDELVAVAGGGSGGAAAAPVKRGPGRPPKSASAAAPAPAAKSAPAATKRGRGGRLGRRSAGDITAMIDSIVSALSKASGGLRAEQIRSALGVEAKELPRPLADALAAGRITKTGQKRATTYFAGGAKSAKKAGKGKR